MRNGQTSNGRKAVGLKGLFFFFKTSLDNLKTVGTVFPTQRSLAEELMKPLENYEPPRRILEIGPGHGSLTKIFLECLDPEDSLTTIEVIPEFASYVEKWRDELPENRRSQVRVVCGDFLEFEDEPFDLIISGVPLNLIPPAIIPDFFRKFKALAKEDGIVATYGYYGSQSLRLFMPQTRRSTLEQRRIIRAQKARASLRQQVVLRHMPPALINFYSPANLAPDANGT